MNNKVAIILCFYNNENTIGKSLESLRLQTFTNFDCFVIDDGSEDLSCEIVRKYQDIDARFRYYKLEHCGVGACRNFALEKIYTEGYRYLAFIDSDDFYALNKLEIQINELISDEKVGMVCSGSRDINLDDYMTQEFNYVDRYDAELLDNCFFELMQTNFRFNPSSSLIDLSRFSCRPLNSLDISGQDYKFFLDLFYENSKKKFLKGELYTCSVRPNSLQRSGDAKLRSAIARYNATVPYIDLFTDCERRSKVEYSTDRYLNWISYQTQFYHGYLDGIFACFKHYQMYSNKMKFFVQFAKRVMSIRTIYLNQSSNKN